MKRANINGKVLETLFGTNEAVGVIKAVIVTEPVIFKKCSHHIALGGQGRRTCCPPHFEWQTWNNVNTLARSNNGFLTLAPSHCIHEGHALFVKSEKFLQLKSPAVPEFHQFEAMYRTNHLSFLLQTSH
jgi:hypothetical protein